MASFSSSFRSTCTETFGAIAAGFASDSAAGSDLGTNTPSASASCVSPSAVESAASKRSFFCFPLPRGDVVAIAASSSRSSAAAAATATGSDGAARGGTGRSADGLACAAARAPLRAATRASHRVCSSRFCARILTFSASTSTFLDSCHASALHSNARDLPVPVGDSMRAFWRLVREARILLMVIFWGTWGLRPSGKCTTHPPMGAPAPRTGAGGLGRT